MTVADNFSTFHPQIREEIIFGPSQRVGPRTIYYIKDSFTNWFYKIGLREYFLISRMDGSKSVQELNEEYSLAFGHSLNDQSWAALFKLLEQRQMLAQSADITKLEELKKEGETRKHQENSGLLRRRFALVKPDLFLDILSPWFGFAFRRSFVVPALLCILGLEVFVIWNLKAIATDSWASLSSGFNIVLSLIMIGLFLVVHEIAHGLTCKHFGGTVSEIGLLWRYPIIFPYCKLDDIMLFHNRWHRVYTSFAGIFVNLLLLLPLGLLWWLVPAHSLLKGVSAILLLSLNLISVMNLIPFSGEMDGYFMLNHALNMVDLHREAREFWKKFLLKALFRKDEGNGGYTRRDTSIYFVYGWLSFVFTTIFNCTLAVCSFILVQHWLGSSLAWSMVTLVVMAVLYSVQLLLSYTDSRKRLERSRHIMSAKLQ